MWEFQVENRTLCYLVNLSCNIKCFLSVCHSNTHYTSGCSDTCHCLDAECDKYTGICPHKCDPGWIGKKCNLGNY